MGTPWILLVPLCLAASGAPQTANDDTKVVSELRTWTDSTGRFSTEATFVKYSDAKVWLKRRDGRMVGVPLDSLSRADQRFLREELKRRKPGAAPGTTPRPHTGPAADAWPQWRGPERNGRSADTGLLRQWPEDGPPLAWKAEDIGHGWSTVAVADGTIYTTGDEDEELKITALTLAGERQWRVKHDGAWTGPHPGSRAIPAIDGKRLYLLSGNGAVGCRGVGDGGLIWERRLQEFGGKVPHWGYSASVLIHDELAIVIPGGDQCIVALDKSTGKKRWATRGYSAGAEYCSPILISHPAGDFVVAATKSGLLGVDVANGSVLWTNNYSTGSGINAATPVYADGHVFWPNGFTKGAVCLKIAEDRSATQVWQTDEDPECHLGDFVADGGYLYGHHDRAWKCFEIATGKELWASGALGTGAVCYADGMLYLFQERRGIAALATCSPRGLDMRGKVQVEGDGPSWAHPVVAGGRLYLRYGTTLYCYNVSARSR